MKNVRLMLVSDDGIDAVLEIPAPGHGVMVYRGRCGVAVKHVLVPALDDTDRVPRDTERVLERHRTVSP